MCGIVGAIADRDVVPVLIEGLKRLEYRGYDSAGIAVVDDDVRPPRAPHRARRGNGSSRGQAEHFHARLGIGHTRWATHGGVTEGNAHPHVSHGEIALVHNGIIENHEQQRERLRELGYDFESQTDTEVIAHLIHHYRAQGADLLHALQTDRARVAWRLRDRGDRQARSRPHGRRAHGLPVAGRAGRGRELRRFRRLGDRVVDAAGDLPRGRRHRRAHARIGVQRVRRGRPRRCSATCTSPMSRWRRWNSARTGTSCRRKSTSSRARSADTIEA